MSISLETRALTVNFGGHIAVNQVSCAFSPGTLTAIVGPNGAGKTTYFNLISGQLPITGGQVLLHGQDLSRQNAASRAQRGLGRAFQLTNLFPRLTVMENVRLAIQARVQSREKYGLQLLSTWFSHAGWIREADEILTRIALIQRRDMRAAELPHGDQRKLEVGLLLAMQPSVFMFDEPTAGMSHDEAPVILDLIAAIQQQRDKTILLVEHKMDVVERLADRIIVLNQGQLVADGKPAEVMQSKVVQEAYLGVAAESAEVAA
ncbi:ABC transporter ATP-binding protein [Undibacterium sp. Jales W-56]|uniref:ABC transporter ATP-binding protein n=1 Tax=Undibacterium sp. Jales W-56 TaxID=2897325 RepID=UPI0021CF2523|nr:ABC transporter ATP-binding protein [Undibacterium sp. Jales W-56]MCU6434428.1 ABC transporter ATP-binding protein [Undibacterium sp. Jales W-56]